jgi:hypothetical protein
MAAGFKKATVNASLVAATLSDYPTYVDLSRVGITTLAEAQSVRVYADSGKTTEWAREIVSATEMHVKVPSLTSTVEIYVDYDGVRSDYAAGDTYGSNAVWSDYAAVYHLESLTADSTANAQTLTNNNSTATATGKIGGGADFGSTDTNRSLSRNDNLGITATGNNTISGWFRLNTEINSQEYILAQTANTTNDTYYGFWYNFNGGSRIMRFVRGRNGAGETAASHSLTMGTSNWYYLVLTYNGTQVSGYTNGTLQAGPTTATGNGTVNLNNDVRIGSWQDGTTYSALALADEVRFTTSIRSANWITTEYNNQNNESSFWGTWTDAGGGPVASRGGILLAW